MLKSKKVVVLGHFGVGKTSLIRKFVSNIFSENYKVTIGVHITKKKVEISDDETISLILWDLEGTDDLASIRDAYLLGAHGVIFVFDVLRPSTFQDLLKNLKVIKSKMAEIPQLVVGNKIDLVDRKEMELLLKNNDIPFDFLTSAKTGDVVDELFYHLATLLNIDD